MTQTVTNSNPPTCNNQPPSIIKFLYSYAGRILPRRHDGKLRYVGGHTRVLSVQRSITFAELMIKFGELCGESMSLRCKMPSEELDVLVSIKSDEDLKNVIEEYDILSSLSDEHQTKIQAILSPINSMKKVASPPSSPISCLDFPVAAQPISKPYLSPAAGNRCCGAPVLWNGDLIGLKHYHYQKQKNLQGQFSQ